MLKRFLPAAIVLLGLFIVGLGIASATLWKSSPTVNAVAGPVGSGNAVITAPGVLDLVASEVTVRASAPGSRVVLVIGRDADVAAWVATSPHLRVTGLSSWKRLASDSAAASVPGASATNSASPTASESASPTASESASPTASESASPTASAVAGATPGGATATGVAPDPAGSDMWLVQADAKDTASLTWTSRPGRWSVLAVSVGTSPIAPELELSWPHPVTTPWLAPAMAFGGLLLFLGLGLVALMRVRTRSPQLVEAWRSGVRVPAGIGVARAVAPVAAPVDEGGLTRREMRERERAREEAPVLAPPRPFARLRANVVTWELRFLPPVVDRVAVPIATPVTAATRQTKTSTPSAALPRSASKPTAGPVMPAAPGRLPESRQFPEASPTGWSPGAPEVEQVAPQPRQLIPTGWSRTAPPVKKSDATGWPRRERHAQQPEPQAQQPEPQAQQPEPTAGRRAHFGLHVAGRPAAPVPAPAASPWGAPAPDSPAIPLPPALVAEVPPVPTVPPVRGAEVHDPPAAGSTRADAWRRAWGFPGIAEDSESATEDVTDAEEGR